MRWRVPWIAPLLCFATTAFAQTSPAPAPQFTIGPRTTVVDGPRLPDGTIDYFAALDAHFSKGVTRENNAAIAILEAVGTSKDEIRAAALYKALGVAQPVRPPFETFGDYVKRVHPRAHPLLDPNRPDDANSAVDWDNLPEDAIYSNRDKPWGAAKEPMLATWLETMKEPLDRLQAAARLGRFFVPESNGTGGWAAYARIPRIEIGETLQARAMLRAGSGDFAGFWEDIQTLHRVARFHDNVNIGVMVRADRYEVPTLRSILGAVRMAEPPPEAMRAWLKALLDRGEMNFPTESITICARYQQLGAVMLMIRGDPRVLQMITYLEVESLFGMKGAPAHWRIEGADWDTLLIATNTHFDELLPMIAGPYTKRRPFREAIKKRINDAELPPTLFDNVLINLNDVTNVDSTYEQRREKLVQAARTFLTRRPEETPAAFATRLAHFSLREIDAMLQFSFRVDAAAALHRVTLAAIAARLYRHDHGKWPATLDDLKGPYLPSTPLDPFLDNKPLSFKQANGILRIYSVGENQKDEEGASSRTDKTDDIGTEISM